MNAPAAIRSSRQRAGLSLRELARRANTSHATLSAYESGAKTPSVATFDRIVRAAGYDAVVELRPVVDADRSARGRELVEVLELAAKFPSRQARRLAFPRFGQAAT